MSNTQTTTQAGFVASPAPEPELAAMWARAIATDQNREHWLTERRSRLTGTDMCVIGRGRPQTIREHMRKKASATDAEFRGNKNTEWGNYREAMIIAELDGAGWHRCGMLIESAEHPRLTSTPDLAGVSMDGEIELREVKTSSKDLHPDGPDFGPTRYYEQILGQFIATGAERIRLHVEQHDDDWTRWTNRPRDGWEFPDGSTLNDYGPRVIATHEYVFERADHQAAIEALYEKSIAALVVLDEELTGFIADGPEQFDEVQQREYGAEARRYADGMAAEKSGKEAKAAALAAVLEMASEQGRKAFSDRFDNIKLTYAPAAVGDDQIVHDEDAAREAQPEAWARVEQAQAALTAAQDQWAAIVAEHTKTIAGKPIAAKATITPPRGYSS